MVIKILAMEESETLINDIGEYVKKSEFYQINIRTKQRDILINHKNIEFLDSENVFEQVKRINEIKEKFDLCLVSSWSTARLAYLCDLNYIIFFVGNDIRIPPFVKNAKPSYFTKPVNKLNFLERVFYKKILNDAVSCVTGSEELYNYLKKYRKDAVRIDRVIVNTKKFNSNVAPVELKKNKFTFFSPQRIGVEKGTETLWEAISMCKSEFEVLQVEWFDEKSLEAQEENKQILSKKPKNVKLISKIKRENMPKYYTFADAVIGEMNTGHTNSVEREASLCKKPVITYNDLKWKSKIDGNEIISPFQPTSKDPKVISSIIDRIVTDKEYRENLANEEFAFMKNLTDPTKTASEWDELFEKIKLKNKTIRKKTPYFKQIVKKIMFFIANECSSNQKLFKLN
jgi:hypothetical protein